MNNQKDEIQTTMTNTDHNCSCCNWTNVNLLNVGAPGNPVLMCHGCIVRALIERDNLTRACADLKSDIDAYRAALGYSVPGNHTGKLKEGTVPQCGICNSEHHKNLEAKCAEMRDKFEKIAQIALSTDCGRGYVPVVELESALRLCDVPEHEQDQLWHAERNHLGTLIKEAK